MNDVLKRYRRSEFIRLFGVRRYLWHMAETYRFRRLLRDPRWKALWRAVKFAGTC